MRSLITPMLLISLGIHGAFLLMPTSEEKKSAETNTEIAQAAEVENQAFPTLEAKPKSEQESQDSKLSQPKEDKKASLPSPKPVAVANAQAPTARRTQGQSKTKTTRTRTNTRATPQPQARKTQSAKTNSSNSQSSRQSQSNSSNRPSTNNSASAATESNSQSASTVSSQQKNVLSNPTTANPTPTATQTTQRRVDNIPTFTQGNSARAVNPPTSTSVPMISSLAPSNSNTSNSASVITVPTIVARTQNQDERVKKRLEFLKTFPRYPEAQWGLPDALQGQELKEFFYRLQTRDGIEVVARKFIEELLPQNKFTGELNTYEENWQVYQVSNGKHTQYLHLISQEGNTGIFLASEEFSRENFIK